MEIVNPLLEDYMKSLTAADDEPVLLEMEKVAEEKGFPIIGRLCGRYLEIQARMIGARRIFELGSGYGYSAYWFSRAVGPDGEIHLTDTEPENRDQALDYLSRAGLADPIEFHVSDAVKALDEVDGEFDIVYCDINKGDYPEAWRKGRERVRVGGLYICDNMLWSGRVVPHPDSPADVVDGWTEAITRTNELIFGDRDFRATINPTRDGVIAALRIR
jgi:caffeoyl-CoA O-methyltransferase